MVSLPDRPFCVGLDHDVDFSAFHRLYGTRAERMEMRRPHVFGESEPFGRAADGYVGSPIRRRATDHGNRPCPHLADDPEHVFGLEVRDEYDLHGLGQNFSLLGPELLAASPSDGISDRLNDRFPVVCPGRIKYYDLMKGSLSAFLFDVAERMSQKFAQNAELTSEHDEVSCAPSDSVCFEMFLDEVVVHFFGRSGGSIVAFGGHLVIPRAS